MATSASVNSCLFLRYASRTRRFTKLRFTARLKPNVPWVVHGFRNNVNIARMLLREDIRLSIGEKYQLPVLQEIPLECLLTETDESRMPVRDIIKSIAEVRRVTAEELSMQIAENAGKIFFQR